MDCQHIHSLDQSSATLHCVIDLVKRRAVAAPHTKTLLNGMNTNERQVVSVVLASDTLITNQLHGAESLLISW
jgi:hypothetical protein